MVAQLDREYVRTVGPAAAARRLASYALFEGRPATTRGQWFNPVVRANVALGERFGGSHRLDRPIFVIGVGRSGTTHLGRLLSAHPEAAWLNEPKLMWHRIVPDEDVSGFYSPRGRFELTESDATPDVTERAHRIFGYYLRSVRSSRLVDKYPEMTYRVPFLRAVFPDARVVAIVRRPEDFVNSVVEWNKSHAVGDQDWWGVGRRKWQQYDAQLVRNDPEVSSVHRALGRPPTEAEMAATEWVVGMRAVLRSRDHVQLVLPFERLALEPVAAIKDVLAATQLSENPRVLRLAASSTSSQLRERPADFGAMEDLVEETRRALAS